MTRSRDEFVTAMTDWLTRHIARPGVTVNADTRLFEGGLIDSIRILELIAYTEDAIGSVIPDLRIRMDNFSSVERIAEVFLGEPGFAAA